MVSRPISVAGRLSCWTIEGKAHPREYLEKNEML